MTKRHFWPALSFLVPLGAYVFSISAWPANWDTAEMQTSPYILGIPHPTGFPLFILIGYVFSHALVVNSVAWRMNLFSSICVAATCTVLYVTALRLGARRVSALLASFTFGFGSIVWQKASHADVHSLSLLWLSLTQLSVLTFATTGDAKWFVRAGWFDGLGLATHPAGIWALPALVFIGFARSKRLSARSVVFCCLAIVAPLTLYLYMPLRSSVIANNHLDPAATLQGVNSLVWDYNRTRTPAGFLQEISGSQFQAPSTVSAVFDLGRYAEYLAYWFPVCRDEVGVAALILAGFGLYALWKSQPAAAVALLLLGFAAVPFAVSYKNVEGDVSRYFMLSFSSIVLLAALAPSVRVERFGVPLRVLFLAALFLNAGATVNANAGRLQGRFDTGGQTYIDATRHAIPAPGIVITGWIDATSLAYAQNIDGLFRRDIILSGWASEFVKYFPEWRRRYRIFFVADHTTLPSLRASVPKTWLTEMPFRESSHHLFEICRRVASCQ